MINISLSYLLSHLILKTTLHRKPGTINSSYSSWQKSKLEDLGLIDNDMEKAMATHSSTLAWKIPWTEEPGRLQSMGSLRVRNNWATSLWLFTLQSMGLLRVGNDWATSLWLFTFLHWRRKWQLTPVLLPGESQGRGSLVGCRLWGRTELDTTEAT